MKTRTSHASDTEHDAVIEGDRRFFRRHAHRAHRMRFTSRAELDEGRRSGIQFGEPRPGYRWVTVMRQVMPGVRVKLMCQLHEEMDMDAPEGVCADLYRFLNGEPGTCIAEVLAGRTFSVSVPISQDLQ